MSSLDVHIDFETFSECDIKKAGAFRYVRDPSTELLSMAYTIGDMPPKLWTPGEPFPSMLTNAIHKGRRFKAHNAEFEVEAWENVAVSKYGWPEIPATRWTCTAAKAATANLPRALDKAGNALELDETKDDAGKRVMLKLSKPRKPSKRNPATRWTIDAVPEDFNTLYSYNKTDVTSERALDKRLPDITDEQERVFQMTYAMNKRGIYVDMDAVECAIELANQINDDAAAQLTDITNGAVTKHTKVAELSAWIEREWRPVESLDKQSMAELLACDDMPDNVRKAVELRMAVAKSSVAKYVAIKRMVCDDGRVRGLFLYHGASTGRWAGRGLQIQNLPRGNIKGITLPDGTKVPGWKRVEQAVDAIKTGKLENLLEFGNPADVLSSCIRAVFMAAPGKKFYVADFSQVEARGVGWASCDRELLHLFNDQTNDPYKTMAAVIYGIAVEDAQTLVNDAQRFVGKQAILGLGYRMGWERFQTQCAGYGVDLASDICQTTVKTYRTMFSRVKQMWDNMHAAVVYVVTTGKTARCNMFGFEMSGCGKFLHMALPSGRRLAYYKPRVWDDHTPWGAPCKKFSCMTVDSQTKKFVRREMHGGMLLENGVQAVCADLMANGMMVAESRGYAPVLTVHDESGTEVDEDFGSLEEFSDCLTTLPDWADGFPLACAGWEGYRYRKD